MHCNNFYSITSSALTPARSIGRDHCRQALSTRLLGAAWISILTAGFSAMGCSLGTNPSPGFPFHLSLIISSTCYSLFAFAKNGCDSTSFCFLTSAVRVPVFPARPKAEVEHVKAFASRTHDRVNDSELFRVQLSGHGRVRTCSGC